MIDMVLEFGIGTIVGLLLWSLAWLLPLRRFMSGPEFRWDILSAVWVILSTALAIVILDPMTDWLSTWISTMTGRWYELVLTFPSWLVVAVYIVGADFGAYWAHRALHTPLLWSTHAWHHASRNLYWLSGLRASPVHVFVLSAPYFFVFMLFPLPEAAAVVVTVAVLDAGNQHLIHSNIRVPFARQLERIFVTPRYHFVHHNERIKTANSNYGFIFSIWDRLFGTYTNPDTVPSDDPLGLGYETNYWRLMLGLPQKR